MNVKFYNSLTNEIEIFKPMKANTVTIYVCGPTVYNDIHIGNARPVIFFDTVARFFKALGNEVFLVTNFTDVDDKIIKKAQDEKTSESVISTRYINAFLNIYRDLNCLEPYKTPKVTETISSITKFIKELVDKKAAYQVGNNVYFRVESDPEYGILSNQKLADLNAGSRIDINNEKENPADFLLWKLTNDEGIKWDSPFGVGRPGWHTECVVMIDDIFKGPIDIHGGGNDLKFPHHENEIAQSHVCFGHNLANYWLHNARIDMNGTKMSKSLGNVVLMKDLLQTVSPNAIRLMILSNHYRQPINFKDELLTQAITEWEKIENSYNKLYRTLDLQNKLEIIDVSNDQSMLDFIDAMSDDFNTSNALTILIRVAKDSNVALRNKNTDSVDLIHFYSLFQKMFDILGFKSNIAPLSNDDKQLVNNWIEARNHKDFEKADLYRNEMNQKGIVI